MPLTLCWSLIVTFPGHYSLVYVIVYLGHNCSQSFHLRRYIARYTVRNLVLQQHTSGALNHDFQLYLRGYTFPNENSEYGYPHPNAILQFCLKIEAMQAA